jgi:putative FmdB family regulatory protein
MPLYEYRCDACGHVFERIQKFSDPPVEVCPGCGEPKVQKLLSSPAIQFKGSGWYITDYARKGGSEAAAKGGDTAAKSSGSESKSGETKTGDSKRASSDSSSSTSTPSSTGGTAADKN